MREYHLKGGQSINNAQDATHFSASLSRLGTDVPILVVHRERQKEGEHKESLVVRAHIDILAAGAVNSPPYKGCKCNRMSSSASSCSIK